MPQHKINDSCYQSQFFNMQSRKKHNSWYVLSLKCYPNKCKELWQLKQLSFWFENIWKLPMEYVIWNRKHFKILSSLLTILFFLVFAVLSSPASESIESLDFLASSASRASLSFFSCSSFHLTNNLNLTNTLTVYIYMNIFWIQCALGHILSKYKNEIILVPSINLL